MNRVPSQVYPATYQAPVALALAALRPAVPPTGVVRDARKGDTYRMAMGPLLIGRVLQTKALVDLAILTTPLDATPLHPALARRATEALPGTYMVDFPMVALLDTLRPRTVNGPAKLWLAADGPTWRIAWPLVVIPDAQAMLPLL